jgi:hypothetical protein
VPAAPSRAAQQQQIGHKITNDRRAQEAAIAAQVAAQAAAKAKRQQKILELKQQIIALNARRAAVWRQTYGTGRDPRKSPEGLARIAEMDRIDAQVEQLNLQIGQLRYAR